MKLWKGLAVVLTGVVIVGLLAACGTAAPTATPTQAAAEEAAPIPAPVTGPEVAPTVSAPAETTTAPALKPVYGGIFDSTGSTGLPTTLDPYQLSAQGLNENNFYNSLIQVKYPYDLSKGIQFEPTLATEWSQSADGSKWTLKLRQGVTWHDGEVFNADDVVATVKRLVDPQWLTATLVVPMRSLWVGVRKVDNYTVELDTGAANAIAFAWLTNYGFVIVPEHLITGPEPASTDVNKRWRVIGLKAPSPQQATGTLAVGTGPFKVTKYEPENQLVSERNPNYFRFDEQGNRLPYLGGVRYSHIIDPTRKVANFVAGNLEYSQGFRSGMNLRQATALCRQVRLAGCSLVQWTHGWGTMMNNYETIPAFKDPRVNAASRYGHDIQKIVDNVFAGGDTYIWMERSKFPDSSLSLKEQYEVLPWSNPARREEYFQKAKSLMADAGYANGLELPLPFFGGGIGTSQRCTGDGLDQYTRHADEINKIGFKVSLECRQGVIYIDELKGNRWSMLGYYPSISLIDPGYGYVYGALLDSPNLGGSPWKWPGVEETDAKFRVVQKTVDETKRNEGYKELERFLANPALVQWPTYYTTVYMAVHGCTHNYVPGGIWGSHAYALERVWIEGECAK